MITNLRSVEVIKRKLNTSVETPLLVIFQKLIMSNDNELRSTDCNSTNQDVTLTQSNLIGVSTFVEILPPHPFPNLASATYETADEASVNDDDLQDSQPLHEDGDIEIGCHKTIPIKSDKKRKNSFLSMITIVFKYIYSFILLGFCITMVMGCIFTRQSTAKEFGIHPIGAFFLFWSLVFWLAMIEGGQGCVVGLHPVNKEKYAETHPITYMTTQLAHRGDNLERFIVGRQFLVVLVIFLINMCGSATKDADPFGLPQLWNDIFLENGVAVIITTIVIGQLTSQVNAAICLLDFINNYLMLFTTYLSLWIEFSGLLHCVYIVQIGFAALSGTRIESKEPPRGTMSKLLFCFRVLVSTAILGFCFAVTLQALFDGNSGMWNGVPPWASVLIFITFLCLTGLMDGMQIAAFALMNVPEEELHQHAVAYTNCQLMFTGKNLQSFLIGRQIFVASLMFIVARIASISGPGDYRIFGANESLQSFYNTGLLGSVLLTIFGSLVWRIIASSYPMAFMSNPIIYVIIRMCLLVEGSGICSASWGLASIHKRIVAYQPDEVYLDSSESCHEVNV